MIQSGYASHVLLCFCKTIPKASTVTWYVYAKRRGLFLLPSKPNKAVEVLASSIIIDYLKAIENNSDCFPISYKLQNVKNALLMPSSWPVTTDSHSNPHPTFDGRCAITVTNNTHIRIQEATLPTRTYADILIAFFKTVVSVLIVLPNLLSKLLSWREKLNNGSFVQKNVEIIKKKKKVVHK